MKLNTNTSVGLRLPKMLGSGGNVQHTSLLRLTKKAAKMLDKDTKRSSLLRLTIKCGKMLDKDGKYYKTLQPIALNNKM